jgi:hypothetical protein
MKKMMLWFGFARDVLNIRYRRFLVGAGMAAFVLTTQAAPPPAVPVFADDFESGTMSLWTTTGTNPLDPSTVQNIVPVGGQFSALMNTSIDRMHRNIIADNAGAELAGHSLFTCYIYDPGPTAPATRIFNEVRGYSGTGLPNGGTAANGALVQLFAIGKYNTVTLPGEVYNANKYQARAGFPSNSAAIVWFNLNAAGSPNRSVGWHRFDIERMPDGMTINFYVDGIPGRTVTNAVPATWDTVILGPGLGSTVGDAWIDGLSIGRVDTNPPAINCPSNIAAVASSSRVGTVVHYAVSATDDMDASPTIECTPPSGSTFPVGTTPVICTATDDAGNVSRCTFDVTVLPLVFEGFEHWSRGQAVLRPESNRLVIANLGSGGNDGWRTELKDVQAVLIDFLPFNYLTETCVVVQVEIDKDGQGALLQTELFLGPDISTAAVDFSALGSDESDVEVRGQNGELINRYRIPNGSRIDIGTIFPPPCINPPTVYSYFQDTNQVWLRFCKPECGPCIGTNCWIEVVLCITAVLPDVGDIKLKALNVVAQGAQAMTSLTIEDIKFFEFGNEHHVVGNGVVDAADYVVWRKTDGTQPGVMEIRPMESLHPGGVHGILIGLFPLDLIGIEPCVLVHGLGTANGLPAVQLGMASLHGSEKMVQLRADFRALGASMVQLEVRNGGQSVGRLTLPNGVIGDWNGDGRLIGVGILSPRDPASGLPTGLAALSSSPGGLAHRFLWDAAMDFRAVDGTMLKGNEVRLLPADPMYQVQLLEKVSLVTENIDSFTIQSESVKSAGEVFFPQDVFPPPTATWGNVRGTWDTYGGGGAAGGLALGRHRLSFFDVFFDLPAVGQTRRVEFRAILEADLSMNGGASSECVGFRGQVLAEITGGPVQGDMRFFDIEILSMDMGVPMTPYRFRESPTLPSHGKLSVRPAPEGGFYMDSFFDVFTELSLDGGTSWVPGDTASMLELMAYQTAPFAAPNLPPAMGTYAMQCARVDYPPNQVIIRNLVLSNVSQGPPLDEILIGTSRTVPFSAGVGFLRSMDGGMTWQAAMGNCQGTFLITHSFDYEGESYYDTEMLQLNLSGGTIPTGFMLRESPTLPSRGRACLGQNDMGQHLIASFFDVFTELSLNGGQTFAPSARPARLTLTHGANECLTIRCPPDQRVWTCDERAIVNYPSPTATSSCGTVPVIECVPPSGSFFPLGTTTVNCRATDAVGNAAFCSFKVEVVPDSAPPIIVCPTAPVVRWICTNGTPIHFPVTATDDCDTNVTIVCNPPSGSPLPPGDHVVVCDAIDDCGKRDRCQFVISVRPDTEPPKINCPSNIVVWTCDPTGATVGYVVTATDDCDEDVDLTCTPPPGHFPPGTTIVTCRAVDGCDKVSTCTFTVTVRVDQEPPRLDCPTNIVAWTCNPDGTIVDYTVTATDDCDTNVTIVCVPPSGSNFPIGTTVVMCRALDDCNHVSFCEFTVSVRQDTEPPRITCPNNVTNWVCTPNGGPVTYTVSATDDCDTNVTIVCVPPSGSNFPPGSTLVDCVATDDCGNKDQCRFFVFVRQDTEPPRLNCPEKIEICTCSPNGTNVTFHVTATDDCDTNVTIVCNPPSGSNFPPGTTTVTCTARDDCGNTSDCSFPVTVIVNTVAIVCPPDIKVFTCSNSVVVNYNVGAANRCGRTTSLCVVADNGTGTARLPANCPYTSEEPMRIIDGLPPGTTIELAPVFHTFVCDSGAPVCADCFVVDNCSPLDGETVRYRSTLNLTLNGTGALAGYNRVLNIGNLFQEAQHGPRTPGNPLQSFATEMQAIQGQITGDPDFDLLRITAGTSFGLPSPGHTTLTQVAGGNWAVDSFFDITYRIDFVGRPGGALSGQSGSTTGTIRIANGPGGPVVVCNPPSGSSFPVGTTTVTCRATNECGFSDTCEFRVTVEADQEPPRILCPNGIVEWTCSDGAVVNYTVTATDDYDTNVTIVCNPPSGSVFPVGVTIVTCVATDDCGKTDRCEFPVRVIKDTEPPTIICPSNIVVYTCRTNVPVTYHVEARDDCDTNVTIVCIPPSGSMFPVGTTTVQCVATDDCGNRAECRFTVAVGPEPGPRLTIRRLFTAPGFVVCWPAPSPGWRLQCAPNLQTANVWQNVTNTPVLVGSQWCVTLPNDARHRFYRLCKPCDPVITGVSHLRPHEGDVITITGAGFGQSPNNLCLVIVENSFVTTNPPPAGDLAAGVVDGVRFIPLRVLSAEDTVMTARMGPVPPDARPGKMMVGHGIGQVGRFQPAFPDILLVDPVWTWNKFGPAGMGEEDIEPQPEQPGPNERCFFSGEPQNGELCVFIQGDWKTNCYISIIARAHDSVSDTGGHDLDAPTVRFLSEGTTRGCVERIVDVLRCAFQQQAGVQVDVTFEEVPPGSGVFKITVRIPGGHIDRGMLTICVRCPE